MIFIGEKPSRTAYAKGWTWRDGRLAAAPLFRALKNCGIDPAGCEFMNLFGDHPDALEIPSTKTLNRLRTAAKHEIVVAMGSKVARHLRLAGIVHRQIVHPAARGRIRASDAYMHHVSEVLQKLPV